MRLFQLIRTDKINRTINVLPSPAAGLASIPRRDKPDKSDKSDKANKLVKIDMSHYMTLHALTFTRT